MADSKDHVHAHWCQVFGQVMSRSWFANQPNGIAQIFRKKTVGIVRRRGDFPTPYVTVTGHRCAPDKEDTLTVLVQLALFLFQTLHVLLE